MHPVDLALLRMRVVRVDLAPLDNNSKEVSLEVRLRVHLERLQHQRLPLDRKFFF